MALTYDQNGTRLADVTITTTINNRINTSVGTWPAGRLNPWKFAPNVIIVGTTAANYFVKRVSSVYTEVVRV